MSTLTTLRVLPAALALLGLAAPASAQPTTTDLTTTTIPAPTSSTAPVPPTSLPTTAVPAAAEVGVVVSTEAEYRAALAQLSVAPPDDVVHRVTVAADFAITDPGGLGDPTYTGAVPLLVIGFDDQTFTVTGNGTTRFLDSTSTALVRIVEVNLSGFAATGDGGAVHTAGSLTIEAARMDHNRAGGDGGALAAAGVLRMTEAAVQDNHADGSGGGVAVDGELVVDDGSLDRNDAGVDGGAAWASGAMQLGLARFDRNVAGGDGGAAAGADAAAFGGTMSANHADGDGGALALSGDALTQFATFRDNDAGRDGGAIATAIAWTDHGTTFLGNHAEGSGGAVAVSDHLDVVESHYRDNVAGIDGGAIAAGGDVTLFTSVLIGNEAQAGDGGGVRSGAAVTADRTTFADNQAGNRGGALAAARVSAVNTTVTGNLSAAGGGVQGTDVSLRHATVVDNEAASGANLVTDGLTAFASVVADPHGGPNCAAAGTSSRGGNWADDTSCALGHATDVQDGTDPSLGPLRYTGGVSYGGPDPWRLLTRYPLWGSPLRDGTTCGAITRDPRSVRRPFGPRCDIGAVEGVFGPKFGFFDFPDVPPWAADAVRWAVSDLHQPKLMTGDLAPPAFHPNAPITRGDFAHLLHAQAGAPDVSPLPVPGYTDVPRRLQDAVTWVTANGLMGGVNPTTFGPARATTRLRAVNAAYRFAGSQDVSGFPPHGLTDVPANADDAVTWAVHHQLMTGFADHRFRPAGPLSRAQAARVSYRLALNPAAWADPGAAPNSSLFQPGG